MLERKTISRFMVYSVKNISHAAAQRRNDRLNNDAAPLRRCVRKLIWARGRECPWLHADDRDVSADLVVCKVAGECRFLRLSFDVH